MKRNLFAFIAVAACMLAGCEKAQENGEDGTGGDNASAFELETSTEAVVLDSSKEGATAVTFTWTSGSNFGTGSAIEYVWEITTASDADYEDAYREELGRNITSRSFAVGELNNYLRTHLLAMDGVEETLKALHGHYRLIVATKGDLTEQMNKYRLSGLDKYFHHCEVMENKDEKNYLELARKHDLKPEQILMIGNSVKSDIAPVVNIGGVAFHTPHEVVWVHEMMDMPQSDRIIELNDIREVLDFLL